MIGACAPAKIDTRLPANHPANPAAEASFFAAPPNPFALNGFDAKPFRPPSDAGVHPGHQEGAGHSHGMPLMAPHSASPADSKQKNTGHQH
jgi:hypothetical protein